MKYIEPSKIGRVSEERDLPGLLQAIDAEDTWDGWHSSKDVLQLNGLPYSKYTSYGLVNGILAKDGLV